MLIVGTDRMNLFLQNPDLAFHLLLCKSILPGSVSLPGSPLFQFLQIFLQTLIFFFGLLELLLQIFQLIFRRILFLLCFFYLERYPLHLDQKQIHIQKF